MEIKEEKVVQIENPAKEEKDIVALYISQLSPMETKAYLIAKNHLGTSFHIQKSNGYIQWLRENPQ